MDPRNPGNRTKAHRLRRAVKNGQALQPLDALWLDEYQASQKDHTGEPKSYGRSRSARKVKFELEEAAEAEGTGSAAAVAALAVREDGRRIDSLALGSTDTLKEACNVYKDVCLTLKENFELLAEVVREDMATIRQQYLSRVKAEGDLMEQQRATQNEDPTTELIMMIAAKHFGLDVEKLGDVAAVAAAAKAKQQKRPPPNGAAQ